MSAHSLPLVSLCGAMSLIAIGVTAQSAYSETSPYRYLFVNPNTGNDASNGSREAPLKTITRALQIVQPNTIILLAPGTYSAQTGEVFPLQMKPNTTIKGEPRDRGQNVVIQGGGFYLSRTFARQNVTILGANQAGLTGVTVSNPNPQGYGLWVESTNPVISDNTFTGSNHDGASVVGNSSPVLRNNYFYQNGANGITIYGTSRPEIQENIFENTGFGINIAQNAAPRIVGNRITQNKDGIVVQGSAQPVLRNNVIDANTRDGMVAIAQSQPNLGTAADPGGNTFISNGQFDINAQKSIHSIPASGNQVAKLKSMGRLDFSGSTTFSGSTAIATAPRPTSVTFGQALPRNTRNNSPLPQLRPAPSIAATLPLRIAMNPAQGTRRLLPLPRQPKAQTVSIPIQVPAPGTSQSVASRPLLNRATRMPNTAIEIPVPLPDSGFAPSRTPIPVVATPSTGLSARAWRSKSLPTTSQPARPQPARRAGASGILPVPSGNIPLGRTGGASVPIWNGSTRSSSNTSPALANRLTFGGLRFRVVVSAATSGQAAQLRSVVPDAFAIQGNLMQAGAFSDRAKADELLQLLLQQGLNAQIQQL